MLDTTINNNPKLKLTANLYIFPMMRINSSKYREGSASTGVMENNILFLKHENVYLVGMDEYFLCPIIHLLLCFHISKLSKVLSKHSQIDQMQYF